MCIIMQECEFLCVEHVYEETYVSTQIYASGADGLICPFGIGRQCAFLAIDLSAAANGLIVDGGRMSAV